MVPHRNSRRIEEVEAKRRAWLHDNRSAVENRVRTGDGDIREARLREDRHVERQCRDAVRQRTDPCRSIGVELDRVRIRRIEDGSAAPVERAVADHRRRDGLTGRGDEPYAEIGRPLEMDRGQAQDSRSRQGDAELVGREARHADGDAIEPGPVTGYAEAAASVDWGRPGSDRRWVHDRPVRYRDVARRKDIAVDARLIGRVLGRQRGRHGEQHEQYKWAHTGRQCASRPAAGQLAATPWTHNARSWP